MRSARELTHAARSGLARAVFWALLGWVLGTAVQLQQAQLWAPAVYGCMALAALLLAAVLGRVAARRRVHSATGWALSWLLMGALAGAAAAGWRAGQVPALAPALEGQDLVLTGVVSAMPQRGEWGWRFRFDVEQALHQGAAVQVPRHLQLSWYGQPGSRRDHDAPDAQAHAAPALTAQVRAGDRWRFSVRLKAAHGNLNPHGFDYELWLWEQGVRATGYVRAGPKDAPPERLATAVAHTVERWRQTVRDGILNGAARDPSASRAYAGIVAALVTGDQNVIERADWDMFRATGVAHLMSISGLHITMFAWLAAALIGALWRRSARWGWPARCNPCLWLPAPAAALIGGVLLAGGYALFSGWGVPARRTVLMLTVVALLRLAGLRWPWWLTWLLACAVVLAFDPWALYQPGFWLSFVAVAVLFATDSGSAGARQISAGGRFVQLLREQWVVTLALTPLALLLFGQASVVGLLANLVAIPWVTLVVTPLALLGVLWPLLWQWAALALAPLAALLQVLAAWQWASVSMAAAPLLLGVGAVLGGVLLALPWPWRLRCAGLPLIAALLLWQPARPAPGQFELLAADVGQGNAVLVRTATHTLMYDSGPRYSQHSDAGQRVLVPLLRALGERLDLLVLSHRDSDHTGGAAAVLAQQRGAAVLSSMESEHALQAVRTAMRCQAGQRWDWDGVRFDVLHPLAADYARRSDPNALSCVLRVQAAADAPAGAAQGAVALLVGDIGIAQEQALLRRQPEALRAHLLLVPHHGSRTSSSAVFLDAVAPRWALVQAGYRNRFGHPAPDVLARYAQRGAMVADSPHCGAATWRSVSPETLHCARTEAARYWHHRPP